MDGYEKHKLEYKYAYEAYLDLPEHMQAEIDEAFYNHPWYGREQSSFLDWENFLINEIKEYE